MSKIKEYLSPGRKEYKESYLVWEVGTITLSTAVHILYNQHYSLYKRGFRGDKQIGEAKAIFNYENKEDKLRLEYESIRIKEGVLERLSRKSFKLKKEGNNLIFPKKYYLLNKI